MQVIVNATKLTDIELDSIDFKVSIDGEGEGCPAFPTVGDGQLLEQLGEWVLNIPHLGLVPQWHVVSGLAQPWWGGEES